MTKRAQKFKACLIQVPAGFIISLLFSIFFPMPAWLAVLSLSRLLEGLGLELRLVGEPQTIDPGAVAVAVLYGLILLTAAFSIFRKTRFSVLAVSLALFGVMFSFIVFAFVSSIIWF
jgi:hypothetical protein